MAQKNKELLPYEIDENEDIIYLIEEYQEPVEDVELVYVDEDINHKLDKKEERYPERFHDESMLMGAIACMEIAETYCDDFCSEVEPFDGF